MNAFISYSHNDSSKLDRLHVHLAQLKRDGKLTTWTDEAISAGGKLDQKISDSLKSSSLFIALLSPDYIASGYCYENEFKEALNLQAIGNLIIIPIILEPCDWLSTPFKQFKALPRDGKAVSDWGNANTAFLDIVHGIRSLLKSDISQRESNTTIPTSEVLPSRNYRIKKDFDSIQKMEFTEQAFSEIKDKLKANLKELQSVDINIKSRVVKDDEKLFEAILVNRHRVNSEATLKIDISPETNNGYRMTTISILNGRDINYSISSNLNTKEKGFSLKVDDYHMFWTESNNFMSSISNENNELSNKGMTDIIYDNWLENVGII